MLIPLAIIQHYHHHHINTRLSDISPVTPMCIVSVPRSVTALMTCPLPITTTGAVIARRHTSHNANAVSAESTAATQLFIYVGQKYYAFCRMYAYKVSHDSPKTKSNTFNSCTQTTRQSKAPMTSNDTFSYV